MMGSLDAFAAAANATRLRASVAVDPSRNSRRENVWGGFITKIDADHPPNGKRIERETKPPLRGMSPHVFRPPGNTKAPHQTGHRAKRNPSATSSAPRAAFHQPFARGFEFRPLFQGETG